MPPFQFIPRTYLHFDTPVTEEMAALIATDPSAVAKHPFNPLITYNVTSQKIRKKVGGGVERKKPKVRPISYAGHKDSHIFAHYSTILCELYERQLQARGLQQVATAFRSLEHRRNIHFADEVFEFIKAQGNCAVLASDISDYFGSMGHDHLKRPWGRLLGVDRLPDDHFAVFRAITRYCTVDRVKLCHVLGLDPDRPRADGRQRFCSPHQFRQMVRGNGLCTVNRTGHGIPQGTPISAVLSNIYMLEFDTVMHAEVAAHGGLFRRYCDDIIFVVPTPEIRVKLLTLMTALVRDLGLEAHPDKTEAIDFGQTGGRLVASKPLNYLGFTFDGENKRIKPASVARFYMKMRRGVGRTKAIRFRACKKAGVWTPIKRRKLHILYSYLGRHNFLSYAFDAAKIMNDPGIKRQVKAHWHKLQTLITQ